MSPRRLAEAIGVSESSIKRWADAGRIATTLTEGGHRRIPLAEAIRFVRESGTALVKPAALGLPRGLASRRGEHGADWAEDLYRQLLDGRADAAVALVRVLYVSGLDSARMIDETIRIAMERFGRLWHDRGEEGVFLEHRATQIGLRILHELRAMHSPLSASAPLALGGAPEGDPYVLPTLAAATVLESIGFATSNLGPETPDGTFVSAIETLRPSLVWLSITAARKPADHNRSLRTIGEAVGRVGGSLVLGGRESGGARLDGHPVGFRGDSMAELAAFAKGLIQSLRNTAADR